MDRLTDNTRYCFMICAGAEHPIGEDCEIYNVCYERKMYEKLKRYEDLEESGRLVVLPCAVGELVYELVNYCVVCDDYLDEPERCGERKQCGSKAVIETKLKYEHIPHIGKTVFLTSEEAEAALKGEA